MIPALSSFLLILLAELPDKTLYTVLLLARRHRALPVLLGALGRGHNLVAPVYPN